MASQPQTTEELRAAIVALRAALVTTLDHLENVLSTDSDMPSFERTQTEASDWLDQTRKALDEGRDPA